MAFGLSKGRLLIPVCQICGAAFPTRMMIDGKSRVLNSRKYCLACSPYQQHNTKVLNGDTRPDVKIFPSEAEPLKPSPDLAYLLGIVSGDGCLYQTERTYELFITCDDRYPDLIQKYAALLDKMIDGNVRIHHSNQGNYTNVRIINKFIPVLLGIPSGAKALNDYSVPEWIFSSEEYVKPFIRGLIETDGGVYIIHRGAACGWHCHFTSYYEPIISSFMRGVEMLGFKFKRKGIKARLSVIEEAKRFIETLEITKFREYTYW